jgi:hypothetical protein
MNEKKFLNACPKRLPAPSIARRSLRLPNPAWGIPKRPAAAFVKRSVRHDQATTISAR